MIIPAGFGQLTYVFSGPSLPFGAVSTIGVDLQGYPGIDAEAADDAYLAFQNSLLQSMSSTVRLARVELKRGPNATGPTTISGGESVGAQSGAVSPPGVALLVHKNTAIGGRQGRGRMFLPGVVEAAVNEAGQLADLFRIDLQGNANEYAGAMNAANLPLQLLHGDAMAPTDIINMTADTRVATQRQRLRR